MDRVETWVGRPIERVEDLRLLRGRGCYADDVTLPGLLHAAIFRSPFAHGRIRRLDVSAARACPGVRAVITAREIVAACGGVPRVPLRLQPVASLEPYHQPVIASDKVRHVGEPLAVVVAASAAEAEDAFEAIALDVDPLPVVADAEASRRDTSLLFEDTGTNRAIVFSGRRGDAEAAFRAAPYTRRERFRVGRLAAVTMEARGVVAHWDAERGHLTVHGAAKVPFFNRRTCAAMLGLDPAQVDFLENDTGGGFGARGEFYPEDFLIPFASRAVGAPVKWIEDRRENLMSMNQARECEGELEIACDRDGRILGLRGTMAVDVGAYPRTNGMIAPRNIAQFVSGPYRVENLAIDSAVQLTNKTATGTFRAPGRFESNFFCERLVELAAADLGIDPVEMRRRNLLTDADMPWHFPSCTPAEPASTAHTETDSGDYRIPFERCLAEFGWREKLARQGRLVDGRWRAVGLSCFIEGGAAGPRENARMAVEADGTVSLYVGSTSVGQGVETVLLQIAADALGFPMERLRIFHGSTTYLAEGFGSYHSRSTVMGGSATVDAARNLQRVIREAASRYLECLPEQVAIGPDEVRSARGRSIALAELARLERLAADGTFANHHHTYAYGTAAAEVAVDPGTGAVELVDYLIVEDVGRAINPLTVHGQVVGSTVQGLGGVFLEEIVYDADGQLLTGTLADYTVPIATDFPNVRAITLEMYPSPINPLGAKGAGEGGTICVGGAIANAVANALAAFGANPREMPLTPPRVRALARAAAAR